MDLLMESLNDICRICLKQDETVGNFMADWIEIVEVISQIKISLNDEYPERICDECMQKLVSANELRNLIIQSNEYFMKNETEILEYVEIKTHQNTLNTDEELQETVSDSNNLLAYTVLEEVMSEEQILEEVSQDFLEQNEITNIMPYRCCFCNKKHEDWEELSNHCIDIHKKVLTERNDVQVTDFHCFVCVRDFDSIENCIRHRVCNHCLKFFVTSESFLIHNQKKKCDENKSKLNNTPKSKVVKQYGCCKCPLLFASSNACKTHFNMDHSEDLYLGNGEGVFNCNYCCTPFVSKSDLQTHLKAPRLKSYVCDQCNEQFSSFPKFKQHIETIHNGTQEFGCDECDKIYDRLESLRYHKYMHHNEKNNRLCPDCGKVFKKKVSFVEHRNIHLGLRPHICSLCESGFTSTGALRTHMRSHTGAKPFKCKYCPKRYSHYSDMKRHSYAHTGNYPFVCETCNKGFAKRSALNSHKTTHENR